MDDYIQNIDEIKEAGIQVSFSEKKEKSFKNWLSNLARQNNKNLGSQRLDCCGFNH